MLKLLPFALQVVKFNHAQAPCDDVNFRRAVTACLNMEETMAIAYPDIYKLDGGWWSTATRPIYTKAGTRICTTRTIQAKAKELLAKSAYKGEKLTFIVDNTRADTDTATDINQQLGQIGIKIDFEVADWPTVSKLGFGPQGWHFWTHGFGIEPYEGPAKLMGIWVERHVAAEGRSEDRQAVRRVRGGDGHGQAKEIFAQFQQTHVGECGGACSSAITACSR